MNCTAKANTFNRFLKQTEMSIAADKIDCCPVCDGKESSIVASGYDYEYMTTNMRFDFNACNKCGSFYINPRPSAASLKIIYPKNYTPYNFEKELNKPTLKIRYLLQKGKVNKIRKLIGNREANIIDVGCGDGFFLKIIKRYGCSRWNLFANDLEISGVSKLQRYGIRALAGKFEGLDIKNKFDLVILNQVIEHLPSPKDFVRKSRSILKKGGYLYIETPSLSGTDFMLFRKGLWGGYHIPRHFVLFNKSSIKMLLESNGFEVVEVSYMISPNFWYQSLHHFFMNSSYPDWICSLFSHKNPLLMGMLTMWELLCKSTGAKSSNMRIIARKL